MAGRSAGRARVVRSSRGPSPGTVLSRLVYTMMSIAIVVLTFRFILRLFGANPEATFVEFVYRISSPLVAPFETVFPTTALDQAVFEWNALLAMAVYALIAWGVTALLSAASGSRTEVVEEVHEVDSANSPNGQ